MRTPLPRGLCPWRGHAGVVLYRTLSAGRRRLVPQGGRNPPALCMLCSIRSRPTDSERRWSSGEDAWPSTRRWAVRCPHGVLVASLMRAWCQRQHECRSKHKVSVRVGSHAPSRRSTEWRCAAPVQRSGGSNPAAGSSVPKLKWHKRLVEAKEKAVRFRQGPPWVCGAVGPRVDSVRRRGDPPHKCA